MKYLIPLMIFVFLIVGCTTQSPVTTAPTDSEKTDVPGVNTITPILPTTTTSPYKGTILAGNKTPYIEFNTEDYQKALSDGKVIFLYFYTTMDSKSKIEELKVFSAFNSMGSNRVIGFKVHYRDDLTTAAEKQLATDLEINEFSTKVILKDGVVVKRSTTSWDTRTYSQQIFSFLD